MGAPLLKMKRVSKHKQFKLRVSNSLMARVDRNPSWIFLGPFKNCMEEKSRLRHG
jgi:hypothetical protein